MLNAINLGEKEYFRVSKGELPNISIDAPVEFSIKGERFRIQMAVLRPVLENSKDWNENGIHKQPSSVPRWLRNANEYSPDRISTSLVKAGMAWEALVRSSKKRSKIYYGELEKEINHPAQFIGSILVHIQEWIRAEKTVPKLQAIAVNRSGFPGPGFDPGGQNYDELITEVFDFNWDSIRNPFLTQDMANKLVEDFFKIKDKPEDFKKIYQQAFVRGYDQILFRKILMDIYNGQCAVCGITFDELLEACHIMPWSQCLANKEDRINPRNGILLCRNHHKLFDAGWIKIQDNFEISVYDSSMQEYSQYSKSDIEVAIRLHGSTLNVSSEQNLTPDARFLKFHRDNLEW